MVAFDAESLAMVTQKLIWTEWLMVFVFVGGVVAWGFRMRKTAGTLEGSFLAGRKVPGFIASLSTVATNLNVNDFIGGAGMMYGFGVITAHGNWMHGLALILVSLFLVNKLRRLRVYSLGEWLEKRYSPTIGIMYSLIWTIVWMLFNLGLYLYGGALVLHTLVGWDLHVSICVLSVIAATYTLIGGFGAVVATDVLQISLMFFPFVFLAAAVWIDIGGVASLAAKLPVEKTVYWTDDTPFGALPFYLAGLFFMGTSYWSAEAQVIQRPLSARSEEDAMISYLGASFWLSLLVPLLISVPALAAIYYFPNLENPDFAMPSLIRKFLPRGLYGVTVVGLVAGVFSSADSQINAFCSMFTKDVYGRLIRPDADERHYLIVSKVAGVLFTFAAIGTAFLVSTAEQGMMLFAISIVATIMPAFSVVTILGATSRHINHIGALVGLIFGLVVAIVLVVMSQTGMLASVAQETLYFRAAVTFVSAAVVTTVVSLLAGGSRRVRRNVQPIDISDKFSPRVLKVAGVLLVGLVGIMMFWTYFFHAGRPVG